MIIEKICKICKVNFNNFRKTPNIKHSSRLIGKKQFSKVKYCSMSCMAKSRIGIIFSKKHRENISKSVSANPTRYWLGKKLSKEHREKIGKRFYATGKNNYAWKGDKVGYSPLHIWVTRWKGRPKICEHCKKEFNKKWSIEWANKSGKYLRDLNDWIRLCRKCHRKYDKK